MTKSYVRTATRSTLKVETNLTQILNFKANFHTEFEPFFPKKIHANNVNYTHRPILLSLFTLNPQCHRIISKTSALSDSPTRRESHIWETLSPLQSGLSTLHLHCHRANMCLIVVCLHSQHSSRSYLLRPPSG